MEKYDSTVSENAKAGGILKEVTNLKDNFFDLSTYVKEAIERIHSDAEEVKYNMETENTLNIGRECVQPLIDVKTLATDIFSNFRNDEVKLLHQEIDVKPYWKHINEMKKMNSETREIIDMLTSLKDSIPKLFEQKIQKADASADPCVSMISIATDLSVSEYSSFGYSNIAATSSPIFKNE